MRFYGFQGNAAAKELLSGCFDSGRVPHAFLIDGPQGAGKKMLASLIAAAVVCGSADGERPCGHCRQCQNALSGNHPDILRYQGRGGARSFSVDTVREIRLAAYTAPNDADKKVFILTDIHNMTEAAQNALLKILEEPPAFTVFVLTCEGKARVLPTVLSRVQLITVGTVTQAQATEALAGQMPGADEAALQEAARLSGGNIGRAVQLLESGGALRAAEVCGAFAKAICGANSYDFLKISGKIESDGELVKEFLRLLPALLRDAALIKAAGARGGVTLLSGCETEAQQVAASLSMPRITAMLQTALDACGAADRYANVTLLLTWLFSKLWRTSHGRL